MTAPGKKLIRVRHGRYHLLCEPLVGTDDVYRSIATFPEGADLTNLLERLGATIDEKASSTKK